MKRTLWIVPVAIFVIGSFAAPAYAAEAAPAVASQTVPQTEYAIGVDDVLEINIIQPDPRVTTLTVAPDGCITFPYIGNVMVKDKTLTQVQEEVQSRLANGYLNYPVVTAALKESRSRRFFVYGEVNKPGPYPLEENLTVLRGISMAGGFTKFGSASRVKVLRPKPKSFSYETLKVDLKRVMNGNDNEDVAIKPGDMIVVSEGIF